VRGGGRLLTPEKYVEIYKQVGSKNGVARHLGRDVRSLRRFVKRNQARIDELMGNVPEVAETEPKAKQDTEPDMPTKDQLIQDKKAQLIAQNEKKIIRDLVKERAIVDIICDKIISAIEVIPRKEISPIVIPNKSAFREHEVVLQISDIQAGTYISKEATGGLNEYNQHIRQKQFKILREAMISIISRMKQVAPIRKLNVHMLGDIVEGLGIFIGQAQHVDQDLYNQVFSVADDLAFFLVEMLYLFDEIEVSCIGGNHGRVGQKGENPHYVNWDIIVYKHIEALLRNYQDRIKFNIPQSWWYVDEIQGWNFLLLHGDDIRSWNGLPYYGIDRADAKWSQLLNANGIQFDYMEMGHFHAPTELPRIRGEKFINGCWPGGSILALKSLVTSSRPCQRLFAVHPERGVAWRYPIWLE
jgi:hypothetical protein